MDSNLDHKEKELRINYVNAISTSLIAFVSVIGLILALAQFIDDKFTFLGLTGTTLIVTLFYIGLIFTFKKTKSGLNMANKNTDYSWLIIWVIIALIAFLILRSKGLI